MIRSGDKKTRPNPDIVTDFYTTYSIHNRCPTYTTTLADRYITRTPEMTKFTYFDTSRQLSVEGLIKKVPDHITNSTWY